MELPKIKKESLTKELREVVGETDIEFDALVDPSDVLVLDSKADYMDRLMEEKEGFMKELMEARQELNKFRELARKSEQGLTGM